LKAVWRQEVPPDHQTTKEKKFKLGPDGELPVYSNSKGGVCILEGGFYHPNLPFMTVFDGPWHNTHHTRPTLNRRNKKTTKTSTNLNATLPTKIVKPKKQKAFLILALATCALETGPRIVTCMRAPQRESHVELRQAGISLYQPPFCRRRVYGTHKPGKTCNGACQTVADFETSRVSANPRHIRLRPAKRCGLLASRVQFTPPYHTYVALTGHTPPSPGVLSPIPRCRCCRGRHPAASGTI